MGDTCGSLGGEMGVGSVIATNGLQVQRDRESVSTAASAISARRYQDHEHARREGLWFKPCAAKQRADPLVSRRTVVIFEIGQR